MLKIQYTKQILGPYRNSSLRILDSDFWAPGHVGDSRVSSIVFNTRYCISTVYIVLYIYSLISVVVTFILTVKNTNQAYTKLMKLKFKMHVRINH